MNGKQLKNSILQWAIQGKLVSQDPNDEPASVLLERIRAEKAKLVKEKKIKKDKNESIIYRGEDNSYYEKFIATGEVKCIDEEIPFEIPQGWEWERLGNITTIKGGKRIPVGMNLSTIDTGHKYIRVADMKNHSIKNDDIHYITDEIYEKIVYDQNKVVSLASIPEFFERVVIVNGFSKCSAMTGWRLGYLACNTAMYQVVLKLFQHSISCTSGFLQRGALTAMDCVEETEQMRQAYEKRKNLLVKGIHEIPGVELLTPAGAFYAWVKFDTDMDSETLCNDLLDKAKIAGVPGIAYGEEDCVCIRFSFAASEDVLRTMLERLKTYQTTHNDL